MMESYFKTNSYILGMALMSLPILAAANPSSLLYISPSDYNHSVRLLHPYDDYWVEQGPLLESIALEALKAKLTDVSMCKANETSDTVIRIKPSLFYNPQMGVFHTKLVATVFSGAGNVLGSYVGEGQQLGYSLGQSTPLNIKKSYTYAMQSLMKKLEIKPFEGASAAENKLPCGIIGQQDDAKINFY